MWQVGNEPVPGYRLQALLGKGSNAVVWRATGPGRMAAALKFIDLSGKRELLGLKEFRGIQRVKEIRHAHLLPITAVWVLDDQGLVMDDEALEGLDDAAHGRETVDDGTMQIEPSEPKTLVLAMLLGERNLHEQLRWHQEAGREGIPVEELLEYMEDAAKGIDFLNSPRHDLGDGPVAIQHCDVKPKNIVLLGNSAMVCDFGLARVAGGGSIHRSLTGPAGTPAYVAPECITNAEPSRTSDQYSLAITYFELRTGRLPFPGKSLKEVYDAHSSGKLELERLPAAERGVIRRATSLDPGRRYPSALEMVRALRRGAGEPPAPASVDEDRPPATAAPAPPAKQGTSGRQIKIVRFLADDPQQDPDAAADDGEKPQPRTYVIRVEPHDAVVTINGKRYELDTDGGIEVRGSADASLDISAVASGYEEFRDTLSILELASSSRVIKLRRDAGYLVDRGTANLEQGNVEAAIEDFDEAIRLAPDLAEAYYGRAMAHGFTPEYRRRHADAFNELAHSHFAKGDYQRAVADFTEAVQINPDLARANHGRLLRNRAVAYRILGQYEKAIADYDEVIRLNPEYARAWHDRALVYHTKGDHDRALEDYATALRLAPEDGQLDYRQNHASAYRERGDIHYRGGDYERALADYDQALRIKPDWAVVCNQRGRTHAAASDWDKAIADYTEAIRLDADYAHLYLYNRGGAYFANGDYNRAIADFSAAIEQKPDYRKAYQYRSRAYAKIGMDAKAEADAATARQLGPT